MNTVVESTDLPLVTPARRSRKAQDKREEQTKRFFLGDSSAEGLSLKREFPSEVEAQLESLKLDEPYYVVESWKAVADLSSGSIAVQKRVVSKKT
jgi:hypothetical protein